MNKTEFVKALQKLNLPRKEFVILSGGSLLMRGLREQTSDLDLSASKKLAADLDLYNCQKDESGLYTPFENVQMKDDMEQFSFDMIDGFQCESLEDILRQKRKWRRPKDLADIEVILKYLKCTETSC